MYLPLMMGLVPGHQQNRFGERALHVTGEGDGCGEIGIGGGCDELPEGGESLFQFGANVGKGGDIGIAGG